MPSSQRRMRGNGRKSGGNMEGERVSQSTRAPYQSLLVFSLRLGFPFLSRG